MPPKNLRALHTSFDSVEEVGDDVNAYLANLANEKKNTDNPYRNDSLLESWSYNSSLTCFYYGNVGMVIDATKDTVRKRIANA